MAAATFQNMKRDDGLSMFPQTPARKGSVPSGHILVSPKWKGTDLVKSMSVLGQVQISNTLGVIDFQISTDTAVVYLMEADIIAGDLYKDNLNRLAKVNNMRIIVMVEKTTLTDQYFHNIQHYVVLTLGLKIVPVASHKEAAQFFHEMSIADFKANVNPFRIYNHPTTNSSLLIFVQEMTGVDVTSAEKLLKRFNSVQKICNATKEELSSVLGPIMAQNTKQFMSRSHKKTI